MAVKSEIRTDNRNILTDLAVAVVCRAIIMAPVVAGRADGDTKRHDGDSRRPFGGISRLFGKTGYHDGNANRLFAAANRLFHNTNRHVGATEMLSGHSIINNQSLIIPF